MLSWRALLPPGICLAAGGRGLHTLMPRLEPKTADREIQRLLVQYRRSGRPIPASFRELLRFPGAHERETHGLHPYPAKLFVNIPAFILSSQDLCRSGATILDPFCGSGTVLLEASLAGHNSIDRKSVV